jgi:hypothetical protein
MKYRPGGLVLEFMETEFMLELIRCLPLILLQPALVVVEEQISGSKGERGHCLASRRPTSSLRDPLPSGALRVRAAAQPRPSAGTPHFASGARPDLPSPDSTPARECVAVPTQEKKQVRGPVLGPVTFLHTSSHTPQRPSRFAGRAASPFPPKSRPSQGQVLGDGQAHAARCPHAFGRP